jgi:hypothetical protein
MLIKEIRETKPEGEETKEFTSVTSMGTDNKSNGMSVTFLFRSTMIHTIIAALMYMFQIKQTLLFQKLSENIRHFRRYCASVRSRIKSQKQTLFWRQECGFSYP